MRKLAAVFLLICTLVFLASCGEDAKVYASDGTFLAYEVSVSRNAPQVVMVSVEIENDEIKGYYIDSRQGTRTGDGTVESPYVWAWNQQTKKELGNDYGMKANSEIEKEWFEQAEAIEAFWLAEGIDAMTKDQDGYIDNITGASIKDAYSHIALEALNNAKQGKFVSIYSSGTDLYSAVMTRENNQIKTLTLDVLQSTRDSVTGSFTWNEKTKQQLGDDYGMKDAGGSYAFSNGEWTSTGSTATLEWYQQVQLISDYVIANGFNANLQPVQQRGGSLDGVTLIDQLAGATIRTAGYYAVLKTLFDYLP